MLKTPLMPYSTAAKCLSVALLMFTSASLHAGPTIKDLAIAEAKKYDADGNGRIEGTEVGNLKTAFAKNPDGWLYIFDDNSNKTLDEIEIAQLRLPASAPKPAPTPTAPAGAAAKAPAAPNPALKAKAFAEAQKFDANRNGRIEGPEVSALRTAFAKQSKDTLSFFDANRNRSLDDYEVAKIKWGK
jgi:hypothetical protein